MTAVTGLIAGCGSSSSGGKAPASNISGASAASELSSAITALGQASTLTASLKLGTSGSQLLTFVHAQDKKANLTAQQASAIAGASISFEVAAPSGKTLSEMSGLTNSGSANISVTDNGKTWFTIRVANQTLYLQADLKDLLNTIGQAEAYRQITSAGGALPSFMSALVQGKWISLPLATLKSLTGALGAGAPTAASTAQASHFLDLLKTLLTKDVTVTKASAGGTDTLTLTTNLRTFARDFVTEFASAVPAAGSALKNANPSKAPNKNVSLVATVSGGALTGLTFDLAQFSKTGKGGSLPLQLTLARSGPAIGAPPGAVAVDLSQLGSLLGSFGGGSGGSSGF
ncbi:MAG TPA: hypothetical protein VG650_17800 [Mycobacteriales bacterium]|nr:hypothetical protein [Mycobacteriales bacterium]